MKKRLNDMEDTQSKRARRECDYGEKCYRLNPAHFREFSHAHLESILDNYSGAGSYPIPEKFSLQRSMITDQLDVIVEKQLYQPKKGCDKIDEQRNNQNTSNAASTQNKTSDNSRHIGNDCHISGNSSRTDRNSIGNAGNSTNCDRNNSRAYKNNSLSDKNNSCTDTNNSRVNENNSRVNENNSRTDKNISHSNRNSSHTEEKNSCANKNNCRSDINSSRTNENNSHVDENNSRSVRNNSRVDENNSRTNENNSRRNENNSRVNENNSRRNGNNSRIDGNSSRTDRNSIGNAGSSINLTSNHTASVSGYNDSALTVTQSREKNTENDNKTSTQVKDTEYRAIVPPSRSPRDFLSVVAPPGGMAAKHEARAPYYIFYTTISSAKETHHQPYSITFLELLDRSLGELQSSLQINFMVEPGWLLAQYYFAGYSAKKLTILYGDDSIPEMKTLNKKKPNVDAHYVQMSTPFGKHHTKMMILCYEDGSVRVVVSTANLYLDDWEDRTQGLWFSPRCPPLGVDAMPHEGEAPTMFKRSLLKYLHHYHMPQLSFYIERVKRCDFSHINVFLVTSAPGSHFDSEWGLSRVGTLLRQHCCVPREEQPAWPLLAQASSLGSYGKDAKLWLTGDFLNNFTKIKNPPQALTPSPELKLIYPSLENVKQSHHGLLGGGCLPYAAAAHAKQPWLLSYLYQWQAHSSGRNRAMPHIKSYTRTSPDDKLAAFYLLTSGNVSKAAWGTLNTGNGARRIMSYEAGVLLMPRFVINEDFFPLEEGAANRLVIPYDIPPTRYTPDMSPWVSDYLG